MKHKAKISVTILALVLIFPMVTIYAQAVDETWGVTAGSDYIYTFGIDGEVNLPTTLWNVLSEEFAGSLNESYDNAYDVGYADTYMVSYNNSFENYDLMEYDWNYTNPYDGDGYIYGWDSYEAGREDGFRNGHYDGFWDGANLEDHGEHAQDWFVKYEDQLVFDGFTQPEMDAVNLNTIYTEFLAMDLVFNMKIHIDSISTLVYSENGDDSYYDVLNMTITFKRATDSTYQVFEEFVADFLDTDIRGFITAGFAGTGDILANITADLDWALSKVDDQILNGEPVMENRGMVWGTGQDTDIVAGELADNLLYEVLGDFGFNLERERTYYFGWSQAYEEGYEDGFYGDAYDPKYEGDWPWGYEYGLEQGYMEGYDDGAYDDTYSYYHGAYYDNWYYGYDEFDDTDVQNPPSGYGRVPMFVPSDLDLGADIELLKDAINIGLAQSHAITLGGFNGLVDQLGMDFVTTENQLYIAGNIDDPKWMFGAIMDLGGMMAIDVLNEEFGPANLNLGFEIDNQSLEVDGVFNLEYATNGNMLNLHYGYHVGMTYDPTGIMGLTMEFDMSEGEHTSLNEHFDGIAPTQTYYPTTVNGVWGIDEGDATEFTMAIGLGADLPTVMWNELSDQMWDALNDVYHEWTGTYLPTSESVDARIVVGTILGSIPEIINIESTVTDMLGISESGQDDTGAPWTHEYDFWAHQLLAKLPEDVDYAPIGMLLNDYYDAVFEAFGTALPQTFADELQARAELDLANLMLDTEIEGTKVSVLEILQQFVPTTLHMWGIESTGSDFPLFAQELGIVDELFFNILMDGAALPSIFYTPLDFSFESVYDELMIYGEAQSGGDFTEALLDEFMTNISVDDWTVEQDSLDFSWKVNGLDDIFFNTTGAEQGLIDWLDDVEDEFGNTFTFDHDTFWAEITFSWVYDEVGKLYNMHLQAGLGIDTTAGESFEFLADYDLSQGEHDVKNANFSGDAGFFANIPGYGTGFMLTALVGTSILMYLRKRK